MSATVIKEFEQIKLEKENGIAVLTLYRPDKMNAFTGKMMQEMIAAFDETDKDDDVKVVIVTGSGERAFCAGQTSRKARRRSTMTRAPPRAKRAGRTRPTSSAMAADA